MRALETPRLRLEPLRAHHAEEMFVGLASARLYEFIAEEPPASVEALRERYTRLESRRSPRGDELWLNWIVFDKANATACGYVQATVSDGRADVAYVLFEHTWGRGLAREAVKRMLDELRETYATHAAFATVDPRNRRSVELLKALEFELTETRRGVEWIHGVLTDEFKYVLALE